MKKIIKALWVVFILGVILLGWLCLARANSITIKRYVSIPMDNLTIACQVPPEIPDFDPATFQVEEVFFHSKYNMKVRTFLFYSDWPQKWCYRVFINPITNKPVALSTIQGIWIYKGGNLKRSNSQELNIILHKLNKANKKIK